MPAVPARGADVEHGEVGGAPTQGRKARRVVVLVHDDVGEHVSLVGHVDERREAHDARTRKLDLAVERKQRREDVREAKAPKDAAAHRGAVAHLGAHDVSDGVLEDVARGVVERDVSLELVECDHGADDEAVLGLLDLVEPTGRQVDDGRNASVLQAQPHAAAQDPVHAPLAQELVRLLDRLGAGVVLELKHVSPSLARIRQRRTSRRTG